MQFPGCRRWRVITGYDGCFGTDFSVDCMHWYKFTLVMSRNRCIQVYLFFI
jgi:hypothetical protein